MTNAPQQPPAGWYPDPAGSDGERFWDGVAWSQSTRDLPRATHADPSLPAGDVAPDHGQGRTGYGAPMGGSPGYGYGYSAGGPPVAGFWWRVLGYVIDGVVLNIVGGIISSMTGVTAMLQGALDRWQREVLIWSDSPNGPFPEIPAEVWTSFFWSGLIAFVTYAIYRTIMLGTQSATLGQLAVGLKTVKVGADPSSRLDWGTAAVRGVVGALLYSVIGFVNGIFAAFTSRKQTLSDLISKTQVYKVR